MIQREDKRSTDLLPLAASFFFGVVYIKNYNGFMDYLFWCISYLKKYNKIEDDLPPTEETLRALMNITMPQDLGEDFYLAQDRVLSGIRERREIVDVDDLMPFEPHLYLYKGDITCLKADAIVNACNERLLGCFIPLHHCIDNAIHSFAGLQVRRDLIKVMEAQGYDEPSGKAKITKGYNLPSSYILHTVGPQVGGRVSPQDEEDLSNCYLSCLRLADSHQLKSVAFCSISTGIYGYPIEKAAKVALNAVRKYMETENKNIEKVVFNVFSENDYEVYFRSIKEAY